MSLRISYLPLLSSLRLSLHNTPPFLSSAYLLLWNFLLSPIYLSPSYPSFCLSLFTTCEVDCRGRRLIFSARVFRSNLTSQVPPTPNPSNPAGDTFLLFLLSVENWVKAQKAHPIHLHYYICNLLTVLQLAFILFRLSV
jgi:hypothetical protein